MLAPHPDPVLDLLVTSLAIYEYASAYTLCSLVLHAHRVSLFALTCIPLNLLAIRTRFTPSVRKSALPKERGENYGHSEQREESLFFEIFRFAQDDKFQLCNLELAPILTFPHKGRDSSVIARSISDVAIQLIFTLTQISNFRTLKLKFYPLPSKGRGIALRKILLPYSPITLLPQRT